MITMETYESVLAEAKNAAKTERIELSVLSYTDDETGEDRYGYAPHGYVFGLFGPSAKVVGVVALDGTFTPAT